jgi:acyl-CoA thioesterase-1
MNKTVFIIIVVIVLLALAAWLGLRLSAPIEIATSPVTSQEDAALFKVIAFGDSLTAGFGVSQSEAYPAQLEIRLKEKGYDVQVINSGVSGETTAGSKERASFIATQNADIVLLGIGGNDALRVLSVKAAATNIRTTIDTLQASKQPPIILLLQIQAPLNAGFTYKNEFDALYQQIADDKNITLVPFLTEALFFDSANKLPDGIHYNAQGYSKVVEQHLLPALERELENF